MKLIFTKFKLIALLLVFTLFMWVPLVAADDDLESQLKQKQAEIQELEKKLDDAQTQEKTLKSQLDFIDNQTHLTELKVQETEFQIKKLDTEINDLNGRIGRLSGTVDKMSALLLDRIVQTYKYNNYSSLDLIFSARGFTDLLEKVTYLQTVQANDKKVLYQLQATKASYNDQVTDKETRQVEQEKLQKDLQKYQTDLAAQKKAKGDLLKETQGSEANYQKLLSQAKAQLASLAGFADSRSGGAVSIVPHSDLSDSWGKYYNQRDANWGKNFIGYSSEQVWEVGCLITSYAMVATHFGGGTTPSDIAGNTDAFSLGTAFFKIPGPSANGHSSDYKANPSIDDLKSEVQAGHPVIAGISSNGGPYPTHYADHWVVLRGVNGDGKFIINDPWYEGAMNVPMSDHYGGWTIIEARIYR